MALSLARKVVTWLLLLLLLLLLLAGWLLPS
jgi:hypothetical protein